MKSKIIWARVGSSSPWGEWWPQLVKVHAELSQHEVQKFFGSDVRWGQVNDALFSFSLFKNKKVIVVLEAEKLVKREKKWVESSSLWVKAPHALVFASSENAPAHWTYSEWFLAEKEEADDKAVFRWIDAIHAENLEQALRELQTCLDADQPGLVCLQLLSRHFRMGRLIQYARDKGLGEQEICASLKLPSFAVQRWVRKPPRNHRQWLKCFEYLQNADLQLKSNEDQRWVLRLLTLKMLRQELQAKKQNAKPRNPPEKLVSTKFLIKPSELFSQSLSPIEPSFS